MKKILLILGFIGITIAVAFARGTDVPQVVKTKFQTLYKDVKKVSWDKEGTSYEAEFTYKKIATSVLFDAQGNVLETEKAIKFADLPKAAKDYLAKNKAGLKISETSIITDAKNKITYEAEVKGKDVIFDEQGNFIQEKESD
ncbi:MAG TPA: PepSY-like domain-containing protein [Bacteroidia bacterium]|nr:PepSY-like domain-containing protein [Bacteroidia bacterium]